MKRALFAVLFLVACGTDDPPGPLDGTQWTIPITGFLCSENLAFPDDSHYTYGVACTLEDGSIGLQVMSGTYEINGSQLTTIVSETSCPSSDVARTDTVGFSRDGEQLAIIGDNGIFTMSRVYPDGSSGGSAVFGCFDVDLTFFPMPVHPL